MTITMFNRLTGEARDTSFVQQHLTIDGISVYHAGASYLKYVEKEEMFIQTGIWIGHDKLPWCDEEEFRMIMEPNEDWVNYPITPMEFAELEAIKEKFVSPSGPYHPSCY